MGRRGPRPEPTALKVLRGTDRADRVNAAEPQPALADPTQIPSWVHGKARAQWRRIAPVLHDLGILTVTDRVALALLCDALADYLVLRDEIARVDRLGEKGVLTPRFAKSDDAEGSAAVVLADPLAGRVYSTVTKEGSVMYRPRPEVGMLENAWERVLKAAKEFGMTPAARTGVKAAEKGEVDPLDAILQRGRQRTTG